MLGLIQRRGKKFSSSPKHSWSHTKDSRGSFPKKNRRNLNFNIYLHLKPRIRNSGNILLSPYAFIARK
jgi:hypothetical protein